MLLHGMVRDAISHLCSLSCSSSDFATKLQIFRPFSGVFYSFHGSREINVRGPQNMHDNVGIHTVRICGMFFITFFYFHLVQIYMYFYEYLRRPNNIQAIVEEGGGGVADQVSELGEDVFAARTAECGRSAGGVRRAECGGRRADVCGARRECGVRSAAGRWLRSRPVSAEPADVCGVRSADRAECGLQTAGPADIRGARTAEYCGLMPTTEFCYLN